jgi:hypothetical protein
MGRKKTAVQRTGKLEQKCIKRVARAIKGFQPSVPWKSEPQLNRQLNCCISQKSGCQWSSKNHAKIKFAGVKVTPDGSASSKHGKPFVAVECKLLKNANQGLQAIESALGKAEILRCEFKYVFVVLYDNTPKYRFCKEFGPGNKVPASLASRKRRAGNVHIVAIRV